MIYVLGGLILVAIVVLIVLQLRPQKTENPQILEELTRDRETRFREAESLKNELRSTREDLQKQFHRVNQTVDTKLSESSKQLNDRLDKSSHVIGNLQKELGKMGEIGAKIENLDKILRAPKGRGSLGEQTLEELLSTTFPVNMWGRQVAIGRMGVVDAVVRTSNGMIPIDAKFPLPAFEALVNADNDKGRDEAQREFQKNVKSRINEVAKYIQPSDGTLDFAILFLPNENIYYEAAIRSVDLSEYARTKKVLITGPNTMLYVLQVLLQAYQSQQFASKAKEALAQLTGVKNQAQKLDEAIAVVEKHIGNAGAKLGDVKKENEKLQSKIEKVTELESGLETEKVKLID
jgi:DNA recombination protein RmuC